MSQVSCTFKPIPESLLNNAFSKTLSSFAVQEQILTDCNTYIKHDQGILEDSVQFNVDRLTLSVTWDTPYAVYAWFTGQPSERSKMFHPKASTQWAVKAEAEYRKDWIAQLEKGMKDNL